MTKYNFRLRFISEMILYNLKSHWYKCECQVIGKKNFQKILFHDLTLDDFCYAITKYSDAMVWFKPKIVLTPQLFMTIKKINKYNR